MEMENMDTRRIVVRDLLGRSRFRLTKARDKSDEFKNSDGKAIYFYWKQGGGINIAIDPSLPFDVLKSLPGVEFSRKATESFGIRAGTSMTDFPSEYKGYRPKDRNSKVGRMFVIEQTSFSDFMSTLVDILSGKLSGLAVPLRSRVTSDVETTDSDPPLAAQADGDVPDPDESGSSDGDLSTAGGSEAAPAFDLGEFTKKIEEECANLEGQDVDAVVKRRVGQGVFRSMLLDRFGGACCITGLKNTRLLIASHIVPWSKSAPGQKLHPDNGLLLSVSMDALFDRGLISFSDNGSILVGNDLDAETMKILGLEREFALPEVLLTETRKENLAKHRERHGLDASLC